MTDEITQAEADRLVWEALTDQYTPAYVLWDKLPFAPAEVRLSLLRLEADHKAALVYGMGWRRLLKVNG